MVKQLSMIFGLTDPTGAKMQIGPNDDGSADPFQTTQTQTLLARQSTVVTVPDAIERLSNLALNFISLLEPSRGHRPAWPLTNRFPPPVKGLRFRERARSHDRLGE